MRFEIASSMSAALVALFASVDAARHGHHNHAHHHEIRSENVTLERRSGQCQFPADVGLVPITPGAQNAGWAMSPNQPCLPGNYCPYACPPGQVSMQWDPLAISYTYPLSMNGGLYCDENGEIQKPFPGKPYCEDGTGAIQAVNKASQPVSFCQTVLPGNEAMLIPTIVEELATLAVPGMSYWCETAAQYYINAPGVVAEEACVWGTSANPVGNWSPYTAGGNTVSDGTTYMKIGWNPIYLQATTPFRNVRPNFGISIECDGPGCNGLPCSIDPSTMAVNEMDALQIFNGAGGATGCVVTIPPGSKANIVVFEVGNNGDSTGSVLSSAPSSSSSPRTSTSTSTSTSTATPTPTPDTTSSSTSTETPTPTPTSTPAETPSSDSTPTPTPPESSSSTSTAAATSTTDLVPTSVGGFSSPKLPQSSVSMSYTYRPHVFAPSGTAQISSIASEATASAASATSAAPDTGAATSTTVSMMSVVFGALAAMAMNF